MSINFNPGPKFLALIDQGQWLDINNFSGATQVVTGSGSTLRAIRNFAARTGTTATSTALARTNASQGWHQDSGTTVINWSKRIVVHLLFTNKQNTANGLARFTIGKTTASGIGALADKGIGIQIDQLALKGIVHNGTSGATIDLSTTLTSYFNKVVTIVSDGAGNVGWFVNGVSKGTSAAGPNGDGASDSDLMQIEADNGGDAADQNVLVFSVKLYMEQ